MLVVIAIAVKGVWGGYQKELASRGLKTEAEAKLTELQKREAELRTDIAGLKSERGIEAELRERYDLAGEGEGVVVIVGSQPPPPVPPPTPYQRFKNWFSW